ncbi:hypothetical protein [Brevibacillus sp. 179-C9.3 HS]|uniref:hypothetical protein n=1 Tax=unclassified Brevibacillus TaxID=2684853 RepID=UPI0039A3548B
MTNEEILELMQRDLDGDLLESELQMLHQLIHKDADLQLMYNRLKDVSQQLEHLPPVVPPFSIVDSILPKLESAAAMTAAVKSTTNEEILPTLEVKRESSSLPESKKWKRIKVWMASLGSTAVAASLLIGMLFSGGDGKKHEIDPFQNGTDMTPAVVDQPKIVGPEPPSPSNNPIPSNTKEEEDKKKQSTEATTQKKSKKPPAKNVQKQTPPPKKTNPTPPQKKPVPPKPVITDDEPPVWPIGLEENPDREDKEPANDDKDDGGDKHEEKDKGKNKEKKKDKDDDDND